MRNRGKRIARVLAIALALLLPAYLYSCCATRKAGEDDKTSEQTDSTATFIPTHPPVVVPHSWREAK